MIYTTLTGRCGNQLFLYAFSRALQEHYNEKMVFCDATIKKLGEKDPSFKVDLELFNVKPYELLHDNVDTIKQYGSFSQRIISKCFALTCRLPYRNRDDYYKRQLRWQPLLNRYGIYHLLHGYIPVAYSKQKNKFIVGTYEDKRWFSRIESAIRDELKPKTVNTKNSKLLDIIKQKESVCVSIRRGDFLSPEHRDFRAICDEKYFRTAISRMLLYFPNAVFVFFSDEIDWVKENYDFGVESYYEDGTNNVADKLYLMSSCKHFILSNSTFSWWAQYLSDNKSKVVISPDHWFNMEGYIHPLIDDDWILIEC